MTATDAIAIIDYLSKANNPLITITGLYFIVFILFGIVHKFFRTRFIEEARESREQGREDRERLKQINDTLTADYKRVIEENVKLKQEIEQLRVDCHILEDRFDE